MQPYIVKLLIAMHQIFAYVCWWLSFSCNVGLHMYSSY